MMDTSKAAAMLGRKGGQAGTGAAKRRGGETAAEVSAYMSALAKRRGKPKCRACGTTFDDHKDAVEHECSAGGES